MLALIAAIDPHRVIGDKNHIPWNIPAERQHFHAITTGHPVIMGHNTFKSLPHLLPNRANIVVSTQLQTDFAVPTLEIALQKAHQSDDQIFIIGGGDLYRQTIDLADTLYISHVNQSYPGDTYFPEINPHHWQITAQTEYAEYTFVTYKHI